MGKFVNRVSQFPNRKVIKIVEETEDGLVADVVNDDRGLVNSGTPLSAEIFDEWDEVVATANSTANASPAQNAIAQAEAAGVPTSAMSYGNLSDFEEILSDGDVPF